MGELRAEARKAWDKLSAEMRGGCKARAGLARLDPIFQRLENIVADNEEWPGAADVWRRNADIFNMLLLMLSDATEAARATNAQGRPGGPLRLWPGGVAQAREGVQNNAISKRMSTDILGRC